MKVLDSTREKKGQDAAQLGISAFISLFRTVVYVVLYTSRIGLRPQNTVEMVHLREDRDQLVMLLLLDPPTVIMIMSCLTVEYSMRRCALGVRAALCKRSIELCSTEVRISSSSTHPTHTCALVRRPFTSAMRKSHPNATHISLNATSTCTSVSHIRHSPTLLQPASLPLVLGAGSGRRRAWSHG